MSKNILLLLGALFAALAFFPLGAEAARASRNLQPGNTYEFSGIDARVVSHVDVGGGQYQFVELDPDGEILRFGFSNLRIAVVGNGRVQVSPVAPFTATFDAGRVRLDVRAGDALFQAEALPGQSLHIGNSRLSAAGLRIRQARDFSYDAVFVDSFGEVAEYRLDSALPQLSVPGGGSVGITARGGPLTVYFPSVLLGGVFSAEHSGTPVMAGRRLFAGTELAIRNESDEAVTLGARVPGDGDFRYSYVLRGSDGHVSAAGNAIGNSIRIPARGTLELTPVVDGELVFPELLLGRLAVGDGRDVPVYRALAPGETIIVTNADESRAHRLFGESGVAGGSFSLDTVLELGDGELEWRPWENVFEWAMSIPPGATLELTVTAAEGHFALSVPDAEGLAAKAGDEPALARHSLAGGESIYVANGTDADATLLFRHDSETPGPDFVLYERGGEIRTFGRVADAGFFRLASGESALLTVPGGNGDEDGAEPVWFAAPRALVGQGLSIEPSERQALVRHAISHGNGIQVDNVNRRFNRHFALEPEGGGPHVGSEYDFVQTQITNQTAYPVFGYGTSEAGFHTVPATNRLNVMPTEGSELSAAFPSEWYGSYFVTRPLGEAPLFRVTVPPGGNLIIANHNRNGFELSNNSMGGPAAFHVLTPFIEVTVSPAVAASTRFSAPRETGPIRLAPGERMAVFAAIGESLEIWMPSLWARQLGLAN